MYSIVVFGLKDFDTESIKKGYINGSVTISPNIDERIMEMIGDEMYLDSMSSYIIEQLLSAALTFKFEMNENGIAVTTTPSYNGILGSLNVYVKKTDKTFSVPKSSDCVEIYDEYDLEEWIENVDVNGFVKSIKKIEILNDIASLFDVDLNSIFEFVEDMDGEDIIDLLDMFY